jgi:hypothetical protein
MSSPNAPTGTEMATKHQLRALALDVAGSVITELALARVARRLREGKAKPSKRRVRRFAGAVMSEVAAMAAADLYWQRRRLRAQVDRRLASAALDAVEAMHAHIPQQRAPLDTPSVVR